MRDGNWKLLCDYDGTKPQLYDLANDRTETTNLVAQHTERVAAMSKALLAWHQSMPPDNGPALAAQEAKPKDKKKP